MSTKKAEEGKVEVDIAVPRERPPATSVGALAPAAEAPPPGLSPEAKARIVDLCRHVSRTDPGEGRKLAVQILADLGVE